MIEARPATDKSQTFNGLLDEIRRRRALVSDYALAKHMGWSTARLSLWRARKTAPTDEVCAAVAAELGLDTLYVIAIVKLDGEPSAQLAPAWKALAKLTKSAAVTTALVVAGAGAQFAPAPSSAHAIDDVYIMRQPRRDPRAVAGARGTLERRA